MTAVKIQVQFSELAVVFIMPAIVIHTPCLKKFHPLLVCTITFYYPKPILIISGRDLADRICYQRLFVFLPHPSNVSALPGETQTLEIASFHSNAGYCFAKKKQKDAFKLSLGYS